MKTLFEFYQWRFILCASGALMRALPLRLSMTL
jgi:hypothetical protein